MSEVLGLLILAAVVLLVCSRIAGAVRRNYQRRRFLRVERIAYQEWRNQHPVDLTEILRDLVGADEPRLRSSLAGDAARLPELHRTIGSVRVAAAMKPCDGVVRRAEVAS